MSDPVAGDTDEFRAEVRRRLDEIHDPCSVAGGTPMGLDEMGLVAGVAVSSGGDVRVDLRFTSPFCHMVTFMQSEAKQRIGALTGVRSVTVTGDQGLDWSPSMIAPQALERRMLRLEAIRHRTVPVPEGPGDR